MLTRFSPSCSTKSLKSLMFTVAEQDFPDDLHQLAGIVLES